jgi:hypothetical protein
MGSVLDDRRERKLASAFAMGLVPGDRRDRKLSFRLKSTVHVRPAASDKRGARCAETRGARVESIRLTYDLNKIAIVPSDIREA